MTMVNTNVGARLARLDAGEVDALVLANAGLARLGVPRGTPEVHDELGAISQTRLRPALQGGVDYVHADGWYAGAWASTIKWVEDAGGDGECDDDECGEDGGGGEGGGWLARSCLRAPTQRAVERGAWCVADGVCLRQRIVGRGACPGG